MQFGSAAPSGAADLAALMFVEPSKEIRGLSGDVAGAERFTAALFTHALEADAQSVITASVDGRLVGFAQISSGGDMPAFRVVAGAAIHAFGVPGAVRAAWRQVARLKVNLEPPANALHLVELHVHPEQRSQGVGAALLKQVIKRADDRQQDVSLTTAIDNPARHLYERHGFLVTEERRDARYERMTGSPGRVLMVKRAG